MSLIFSAIVFLTRKTVLRFKGSKFKERLRPVNMELGTLNGPVHLFEKFGDPFKSRGFDLVAHGPV